MLMLAPSSKPRKRVDLMPETSREEQGVPHPGVPVSHQSRGTFLADTPRRVPENTTGLSDVVSSRTIGPALLPPLRTMLPVVNGGLDGA